ncbi:MAG: hypothetical protein LLG20_05545, partial [Acidobacteriales bacterium]|nr:hypothetical protein [Terriglobales bacterium]
HFVLEDTASPVEWKQTYPLASRWYNKPGVIEFDTRPREARPAGWYRFESAPGLRALTIAVRGKLQAWADGEPMSVTAAPRADGVTVYKAAPKRVSPRPVQIAIRIEQQRGQYGGAAIPEPILEACAPGLVEAGDWSLIDGLASYSGGAWYRKTIELSKEQVSGTVLLDLGRVVSSAEVHVNGKLAATRLAPPWKVDISKHVHPGANRIEVLVYNTLANRYQDIPTRYRGSATSGLLGPLSLEVR